MNSQDNRREAVRQALHKRFDSNVTQMAKSTKITRPTLYRIIDEKNTSSYISGRTWEKLLPWVGEYYTESDVFFDVVDDLIPLNAIWGHLSDPQKKRILTVVNDVMREHARFRRAGNV